jgi:hypothetical protein
VFDGEAVAGPGVKDTRCREKVSRQLLDPFPREAILLAASPKHASPDTGGVESESLQCQKVRWHCVIGKETVGSVRSGASRSSSPAIPTSWLSLAALPELTQMVRLNFKQAGFHCRGAPQSPQQTG